MKGLVACRCRIHVYSRPIWDVNVGGVGLSGGGRLLLSAYCHRATGPVSLSRRPPGPQGRGPGRQGPTKAPPVLPNNLINSKFQRISPARPLPLRPHPHPPSGKFSLNLATNEISGDYCWPVSGTRDWGPGISHWRDNSREALFSGEKLSIM